jgi:peptide/nickel transport system permease protein
MYLPLIALGVSALTFFVLRSPWSQDPVVTMLGTEVTPKQQAALRGDLGLDRPLVEQYVQWLSHVATGDFGKTFRGGQPVGAEVARRLPITLEILGLSTLFVSVLGVTLGVVTASHQNSAVDHIIRLGSVLGQSIPNFFLLVLLIVLPSIWWNYVPPVGGHISIFDHPFENLRLYLPPTLILAVGGSSRLMRLARSTMLEVLRQDYMRTAQAKGLSRRAMIWGHALRNSLIPIVTFIGSEITVLFFGALILEQVFSINGIGQFFYTSVISSDFPVVQFLVLYTALIVVCLNLLVDLSYAMIDPKVRYN